MTSEVMTDTKVNSNPVQSFRVNIFVGINTGPGSITGESIATAGTLYKSSNSSIIMQRNTYFM